MEPEFSTLKLIALVMLAIWIWVYYRLLKGAGVLFDVYPTRLYIYGTFVLGVVALLVTGYVRASM
jgi:hypothetical protein